jgi:ABC-type lipoprotein release transport system permease subunit
VRSADPVSFAVVAVAMMVTALFACWLPARRAMRVRPADALRAE